MLHISQVVAKAEEMYDLFNAHFYGGELGRVVVTVSSDNGSGAYGWCSTDAIWHDGGSSYREINLSSEYLSRPIDEVAVTMLHEMAHLHNMLNNIQDVSNAGFYHNSLFRRTAEAHGLRVERHASFGWIIASLTSESADWLHHASGLTDFSVLRTSILPSPDRTNGSGRLAAVQEGCRNSYSLKYVCPNCRTIVRAARPVSLLCADCGAVLMQEQHSRN